jgi:hypothetical protein
MGKDTGILIEWPRSSLIHGSDIRFERSNLEQSVNVECKCLSPQQTGVFSPEILYIGLTVPRNV